MKLLCTDLDNTLIYSYKHELGNEKRNVELYQGREISFITEKTYELLKKVNQQYQIVPVTTRTVEQYQRIHLGIHPFQYALTCNGGMLLVDGKREDTWYLESRKMTEPAVPAMKKAMEYLEKDARRKFELRYIEELFVFTKCKEVEKVIQDLKKLLKEELVEVFSNGEKLYVLPVTLSKGNAVKRLKAYLEPDCVIAAGDSEFDKSMVCEADKGFMPEDFPDRLFSEAYLEKCLEETEIK